MTANARKWLTYYLCLTLGVSSFVSFEPALYDLLFISIVAVGFLFSFIAFTKETVFPLLIVIVFLLSNLLSLFFLNEFKISIFFTGITMYLILTWIGLVGMGFYLNGAHLELMMKGYLFSAFLAASIGILAYFQLLPSSDTYLTYGRATAFFKDPNVFGPYLIMPALLAISMTEMKEMIVWRKMVYYLLFLILVLGVIVSFSRAAWGSFGISFGLYLLIVKKELFRRRIKTIVVLAMVGIPIIAYFIQSPMVEDILLSRFSLQKYDIERFDTQQEALLSGLHNPFGIGAGQSENAFQIAPHSLYARIFAENGIAGLISIVTFLIVSIYKSYQNYKTAMNTSGIFHLVVLTSLIGLVFNSFFVDTLHWRHLWLILALAWVPSSD
ncbi:O-antigen ligase family protein [Sporosarcina sp. ANT_H38]|uniref:O-antigen ligase family protein n=1 Tax=Sporosarcina sp. ANT_H38 TaxID=2597358 RepID=UPI0011F0B5D2|nr:O-antigen ligase family protein [Sporosarcina sp. ANT_H38]KAA0944218.1 O-antigen ligase family protein [Sporosarcina sp. ANT_H38]